MTTQEAVSIIEQYITGEGSLYGDAALAALRVLEAAAELADLVNSMPDGSALCKYTGAPPWRCTGNMERFESPQAAIRGFIEREVTR